MGKLVTGQALFDGILSGHGGQLNMHFTVFEFENKGTISVFLLVQILVNSTLDGH